MNKSTTKKIPWYGNRWKTLLVIAVLFAFSFTTVNAQTVEVGNDETTTSNYVPFYYLYQKGYSQTIYTADELHDAGIKTDGGTITTLRYKPTTSQNTSNWKDWTVYIGTTTKEGFDDGEDWVDNSELTQVFDGEIADEVEADVWLEIDLDQSFDWDGQENIVIAVNQTTAAWGSNPSWAGYELEPENGSKGVYDYRDGANFDPANMGSGTTTNTVAQIQLDGDLMEGCTDADAGIAMADFSICEGVAFTLETENPSSGEAGLSYQWEESTDGSTWSDIDGANSAIYTVADGIDSDMYYRLNVICENGGEDTSDAIAVELNTNVEECYCEPEGTNSSRYIDNFSATGDGDQEIDNQGSGFSDGGYGDFTNMVVSADADSEINFDADIVGGNGGFRVWVDWNNDGIFDPEEEVAYQSSGYSANHEGSFDVPGDADGDYRMRIVSHWLSTSGDIDPCETGFSYGEFEDYTVSITPVDCLSPSDLEVTEITANSATVSWESDADNYNYAVTTEDEEPADADDSTGDNSVDLDNLDDNTTYYVWVQADCGESQSNWKSISFTTACDATDIPFTQDFEGVDTPDIPNCASLETNSGNAWKTISNGINGNSLNYSYHSSEEADSWYFTQGINLEEGVDYQISYAYGNSGSWEENLKVAYGTAAASSAMNDEIANHLDVVGTFDNEATFTVDADGVYYFGFQAHSNANKNQLYVDDIQVDLAPTCPMPSDLVASEISENTADISWTDNAEANQWEVIYGENGFDVDNEGENVTVENNPSLTLTDLSPGTSYDVYVSAVCGADDESELTDPLTFTTQLEGGYCLPEGTNSGRYINNFSTSAGIENISNMETGFSTGGYGNFMDMMVSQVNTQEVSFESDIVGGTAGFRIWVDWNQDGEFTEDEVAYQSSSYSASHSGSFTVPIDADTGQTRMRIVSNWSSFSGAVDPCATGFGGGEFEDYTFEVIALDACADATAGTLITEDMGVCAGVPFTLEVENDSEAADGISRQWMSSTDGETWEEIEGATTSTYTVSEGISEETQYKYVVTCSEDDSSDETAIVTISLNPANECYCEPAFSSNVEPITYVSFAEIDNSSDATINGSPALEDFTDQTAFVNTGEEYPIEVQGNTSGNFTTKIVVYIDWNQDGVFDDSEGSEEQYLLPDIVNSTGEDGISSEGNIEVPESALIGDTRMRVMKKFNAVAGPCNTAGYGQAEDYTINVSEGEPSLCEAPTDVEVTDITHTTAEVSWTVGAEEGEWEVIYGEAGFDTDSEGESVLVEQTSYTIEDLEAETEYDVYVRSVCGEDDFSDWTGPETFTTESSTAYCSPFTEASNSAPDRAQPDRNTNFTTTGAVENFEDETVFEYEPGAGTTVDDAAPNGYADLYDTYTVKQYSGESFDFSVDYKGNGVHYYIWIDFDQDNQFEDSDYSDANTDGERFFMQNVPSPADPTISGTINIPEDIEVGEYRMRIRGINDISNISDLPCDEIAWGEARDYKLEVLEGQPDSCQSPELVEITNITETTANVSWTAGADEDQWEVLYGETGFDTDTEGESVLVGQTSYTIEDLEADTEYDIYVRSVCEEDVFSDWTGPETFTTEGGQTVCEPTYSSGCDFGDNVDSVYLEGDDGTLDDFDIGCDGNLQDKTNEMSVTLTPGETYEIEVSSESASANWVAVFINTGDDFELVGSSDESTTYNGPPLTFDIVIPANMEGEGVLRVMTAYNLFNQPVWDACGSYSYGSAVDYGVNLSESVVSCEAPTDVEVTEVTDTTADVSWTAGAEEDQWEVLYGESGFDTDSDGVSVIVEVVTLYTIADLNPETEYDVYVRSICDEDNFSDWTGPETFTTEEEPVEECEAPTDVEVTDVTETTAEVTWTPQGDEESWAVIYGESGFSQDDEDDFETDIVLAPTHTLEDLTPLTDYDVYVFAICDEDEMIYSDQVGPITFTTDDMSVDSQEFNNFTYYPNPVENQLSLKAGTQIDNVQVYNLLGQQVIDVQPNSLDAQINTEALQSGIYLMKVSINGSQKTFRVVKK